VYKPISSVFGIYDRMASNTTEIKRRNRGKTSFRY